jgi:hypothetical protein
MNVIEEFDAPIKSVCPQCGDLFEYRSNKTFCSPKCRKAHSKLVLREGQTKTINKTLPSEQRQNLELKHLNLVLCEKVYTMSPGERVGYVEDVLQMARHSEGGLLRHLLSNKKYQYPNREQTSLFFRRSPQSYKTFPQICNHYLLNSPWGCYLSDFLKGGIPEPSTGEVLADGTIDIRVNAQGWKPAVAGYKRRNGEVKRVQKGPVVDPTGLYINHWYYDGATHRTGALVALKVGVLRKPSA